MEDFFKILNTDGNSRTAIMSINNIEIQTPCFMPVATQASVKSLDSFELKEIGYKLILSNIYHMAVRPGINYLNKFGGIHKFMNWDGLILTDSGGFQGYSLAHRVKIKDDGIVFQSHLDGKEIYFKPKEVVKYQEDIGSNIMMPLDICLPKGSSEKKLIDALETTYEWAKQSISARSSNSSKLFGIIQGGNNLELRELSANKMTGLNFDGFAYGGLSVGEDKELMINTQLSANKLLPENKPRYLMGIGSPEDLVRSIYNGFDMFDCVLPTRIARNGSLFTKNGRLNVFNAKYKDIDKPIDTNCNCYSCKNYSLAYVHHLFKSKELLGYRIASIHNLAFLYNLMNEIQQHITNSDFSGFVDEFLAKYKVSDPKIQQEQKFKWIKSQGRNTN
ncbi:MAG: tRNA guanosine(34) transglycosylase Tgt [Chloroflexi bacterium]|nr:tRNA guanosine(34) transglycosylase Tgt [Chloroflexota bacterium]|tara:strand:+ start:322 stop:1491 length:1170 start_codon:yes stop_codon:yes gene_type:complete